MRKSYYFCKRNVTIISANRNIYEYKSISCDIFSDLRLSCLAYLWYEGDERGIAEDGRIAVAPHPWGDDHQSFYRYAHRYVHYLCRTEFLSYHRDDGFLCQCGASYLGASHLGDHGCQHRYYAHGMDYVARLQCRFDDCCLPGFLLGYHVDI